MWPAGQKQRFGTGHFVFFPGTMGEGDALEGRLLGVETVNRPADHMAARRLIGNHIAISPADAADESVDLKRLATAAAAETRS